jgi:hypothetical protein
MWCKRCTGKVLVDRVFTSDTHVELFCFNCGKRWVYHHPINKEAFVVWIWKAEKSYMVHSSMGNMPKRTNG